MPPSEPVTLESIAAMLTEIREQAAKPAGLLLTQREAWEFCGLSRASWFRLRAADKLPRPVSIEGTGLRFRRRDLEVFVERLKPARRKATAAVEVAESGEK